MIKLSKENKIHMNLFCIYRATYTIYIELSGKILLNKAALKIQFKLKNKNEPNEKQWLKLKRS